MRVLLRNLRLPGNDRNCLLQFQAIDPPGPDWKSDHCFHTCSRISIHVCLSQETKPRFNVNDWAWWVTKYLLSLFSYTLMLFLSTCDFFDDLILNPPTFVLLLTNSWNFVYVVFCGVLFFLDFTFKQTSYIYFQVLHTHAQNRLLSFGTTSMYYVFCDEYLKKGRHTQNFS